MTTIVCNGVRFDAIEAVIFDKDGTLADSHQYLRYLGEKRADAIVQALRTTSVEEFSLRFGGGYAKIQTQLTDSTDVALKTAILETLGCSPTWIDPAGRLATGTREDNEITIATLIAETGYDPDAARSLVHFAFLAADRQLPRKATLTPPFTGTIDLLKSLTPLRLAILSSDTEANIRDFVDFYQLSPCFSTIVGAQSGISKPNPKLLSLVCEALNVEPTAALVIGDTSADTKLTQCSIGVTWGGSTVAQLLDAAAIAHQPSDIQLSRS